MHGGKRLPRQHNTREEKGVYFVSLGWGGLGWVGLGLAEMGCDAMGWNAMDWAGMRWTGLEWVGTSRVYGWAELCYDWDVL